MFTCYSIGSSGQPTPANFKLVQVPVPVAVPVVVAIGVPMRVHFESGSEAITAEGKRIIDAFATIADELSSVNLPGLDAAVAPIVGAMASKELPEDVAYQLARAIHWAEAPLAAPTLLALWAWDEPAFLRHTEGNPIRRIGWQRWRRCACASGAPC